MKRSFGVLVCLCGVLSACARDTAREQPAQHGTPQAIKPIAIASESTQVPASVPTQVLTPPPPPIASAQEPRASAIVTVSEFVRVDREQKFVELDGAIAIDVHGDTPKVYLEVLVCAPNTREHEALVVTRAPARDVHAALLLLGLEPGKPGAFVWQQEQLVTIAPTGAPLRVLVQVQGSNDWQELASWVQSSAGGEAKPLDDATFVFAGSVFRTMQGKSVYAAEPEGTIVGLTTFGTETVALTRVMSPDASSETPHLIANVAKMPAFQTPVKVRLVARR